MTFEEFKKQNYKEKDRTMKNKKKANEILDKILMCPRCKKRMRWIENTNIIVCDNCTYSTTHKEKDKEVKKDYSVSRTLNDKNKKFLEINYHLTKESWDQA